MIRCMVANKIDNRRRGSPCVMQIRNTIAEARAEMKHRYRRLPSNASIAVSGSSTNALKQTEDAAHLWNGIHRLYQMHFRRPRIGKTSRHTRIHQRPYQRLGSIHLVNPLTVPMPQS